MAYRLYLTIVLVPFSYLEDLDCNGFRLICSPPGFRNNTRLLRKKTVLHNTRENVRCRYDTIAATNPTEVVQGSTPQFGIQLFIGIQVLGGKATELEVIGGTVERIYVHERQRQQILEHPVGSKSRPLEPDNDQENHQSGERRTSNADFPGSSESESSVG